MQDFFSSEFQENHYRNKVMIKKTLRFVFKPTVFLTLGVLFLFAMGSAAQGEAPSWYPVLLGLFGAAWLLYVPLALWLKFWHGVGRAGRRFYDGYRHGKAVSIPASSPNAASLTFITTNYKDVFNEVGLCAVDQQAANARNAMIAGSSLMGKGRIARAAHTSALMADQFGSRRTPELLAVTPVDSYRSDLLFQMVPGQTASRFEALHEEIASGFRVPRVSVAQDAAQRAQGAVCLTVFHQDALEESNSLDVAGWFE